MIQNKKESIYAAVLELINEKGEMANIKVADIAKKANVGKGTVYEYFESKEQILVEAIMNMFKQGIGFLNRIVESEKAFQESYMEIIRLIGKMMDRNRIVFKYMSTKGCDFSHKNAIGEIFQREIKIVRKAYIDLFEKIVQKGMEEGVIQNKPSKFDLYIAVANSVMCLHIYKQEFAELEDMEENEVIEKAYDLFVKVLG